MKFTTIPAAGLIGEAAIREAAAAEFGAVMQLVRAALAAKLFPGRPDAYVSVDAFFPERVITCRNGRYYAYPYTIDDANQVQIGEPVEVVEDYKPVGSGASPAPAPALMAGVAVFEAAAGDTTGTRFLVNVICAGLSGNGNYYPDAALREAVAKFNGVRVFVKSDAEHIAGAGKDVRNLIGRLGEARFVEGAGLDTGRITAVLSVIDPAEAVVVKMREAVARGMGDLFGLSIDALCRAKKIQKDGKTVRVAESFTRIKSVDVIVEPGAGGGVVRVVEAADDSLNAQEAQMKAHLFEVFKAKFPAKAKDKTIDDFTEEALREALFGENSLSTVAMVQALVETMRGGGNEPAGRDMEAVVREAVARSEARLKAKNDAMTKIFAAGLPVRAANRVYAQFKDREEAFTEAEVDEAIAAEREYIGQFTESGRVRVPGNEGGGNVVITEPQHMKVRDMLDAFFDPNHANHRAASSFKECYIAITGDRRVTGRIEDCDLSRMREALGDERFAESLDASTFSNVLGSAITRRMLAEYRNASEYDGWRRICNVVPVSDFRTQERTRFGGYGDLPAVNQGGPYLALTSPSDEKATYGATKRGGTEDVTLEMIKNDDAGVIMRLPVKLGRAAKRTLSKFVFDFIRTNPTIYDSVVLFHASHGNLGAAALDATSLAARRLAMLKQAELSSADRLGIGPKGILVPLDLQEAAVNLFNRNTNNDRTFVNAMTLEIIPVWYWTDTNDWALFADPMDIPGLEVGFLDGAEEPQLFVQDNPTVGSMFSHDKVTWKIRHIYGGAITDFRAFDKSVV